VEMLRVVVAISCLAAAVLAVTCVDGKDNIVTLADVGDAQLKMHFTSVNVRVYTTDMKPSCHSSGEALLALPGVLKIISGTIKVDVKNDVTDTGMGDLTLKSAGLLGTVCDVGKSKNGLIGDSDCALHICTLLGDSLCNLLENPGTYDLQALEGAEQGFNGTVGLPSLGVIGSILTGKWQLGMQLKDQNNLSELLVQVAIPPSGYIYMGK